MTAVATDAARRNEAPAEVDPESALETLFGQLHTDSRGLVASRQEGPYPLPVSNPWTGRMNARGSTEMLLAMNHDSSRVADCLGRLR